MKLVKMAVMCTAVSVLTGGSGIFILLLILTTPGMYSDALALICLFMFVMTFLSITSVQDLIEYSISEPTSFDAAEVKYFMWNLLGYVYVPSVKKRALISTLLKDKYVYVQGNRCRTVTRTVLIKLGFILVMIVYGCIKILS